MIHYKRFLSKAIILTAVSLSGFSAFSQEDQSAAVKQSADTLNTKIENVKSDLDLLKKLKISGYIQAQWQLADTTGQASAFSGGNFPKNADNRFAIRRGRVKFTYEGTLSRFVVQIDATEKGVALKDAYVNFKDPWLQMFSIQGGVFDRPFGYEISYSSSLRETPERSRVYQTLFPGERDLGAMLTIQPRKESRFNFIRLNAALIAGNGIAPEIDSKKDFVGQLGINRTTRNEKFRYAIGVSYYNGGFFQETPNVYKMTTLEDSIYSGKGFLVDTTDSNKGEYARREYYGLDAQFSLDWMIGLTTLRGEYITGTQPGTSANNISPNNRLLPNPYTVTSSNGTSTTYSGGPVDTYIRNFNGGYVYFIQNILHSRHEIVVKWDYLDPNTKVSGNEITSKVNTRSTKMGVADIKYTTWGFGYNVRLYSNLKLMAYYEIVKNENTSLTTSTANYTKDIKDNVFTLRLQFKF